ncbi:MAG TPA: ABC transporter ATP-binding protein [Candidatus Limnocylindrales bacterium]
MTPSTHPSSIARSGPTAVAFDGVSRRFGDTVALDEIDLGIAIGETVALLGPNGAGKTTAIGIMLGLLEPSTGLARTLGLAPHDAVRSGRVGAMLQSAGLPPGARVGELVDLARGLYPAPAGRDALLERAGLADLVERRAETLSGGEAQRVRFAFAIAGDPDLVFLDEPTVAMDVESRRAFWDDMRRFAAEGRTVLFATHYLDEADQVADRIVVLDRGRIVGDGSPAALKATVTERTVRFALPDGGGSDDPVLRSLPGVIGLDRHGQTASLLSRDADETVRGLVAAGIAFRHLEVAGADLDAAFLALTSGPREPVGSSTPAAA